jgi:hypothetical protein
MIVLAETLFIVVLAYLAMGALYSVALHLVGLRKIDPGTVGAGWWFRLLITPGLIALWPLMFVRWRRAARTCWPVRGEIHTPLSARGIRRAHGRLALTLLVIAPLLLLLAVVFRPAEPEPGTIPRYSGDLTEKGEIVAEHATPFEGLPIELGLRRGESSPQLELALERDLSHADVLLYWTPRLDKFPHGATYIGNVWGPGRRRYELTERVDPSQGLLVLYSRSSRERIGEFSMAGL